MEMEVVRKEKKLTPCNNRRGGGGGAEADRLVKVPHIVRANNMVTVVEDHEKELVEDGNEGNIKTARYVCECIFVCTGECVILYVRVCKCFVFV
jgi:hypothetical protein